MFELPESYTDRYLTMEKKLVVKIRFKVAAAAIGVVSLALTGGSVAQASTTPSASALPDFVNAQVPNFAADVVSEDLTPVLEKTTNYVGQRITAAGLEVVLSSASTAAETALIDLEATAQATALTKFGIDPSTISVPISVRIVPNSLATLTNLVGQLNSDQDAWAAKGISLDSWGPDLNSDLVVVHLQSYSATAAQEIESAYGPLVTVAAGDQSSSASSRTSDVAPWWGGDPISSATAGCTSWFSVISASGAAVSPTAGHCGAGTFTQGGHAFGTVTSRHFGGSMDGELIPLSSNGAVVWSDPTSTSRTVTALAAGNTVGALVCTDGAVDREVCSVRIDSTGNSVTYGGQTITGLVGAHQTSGRAAFTPGDSGGPIETTSGSSQSIAQGMLEAVVNGTGYSQGWYMPARTVDSYFNVFVKTS